MSQRGVLILFIFVLIIGVLIGGWFFISDLKRSSMLPVETKAKPVIFRLPDLEVGSSTSLLPTSSGENTWETYSNDEFNFEIKYPADLTMSTGSTANGVVLYPTGSYYASGTPEFWFGTINIDDTKLSPGRPVYSVLVVMPTQCYQNYWGRSPTSTVMVNGITMEKQVFGASTLVAYYFTGNPRYGWSRKCNTILIRTARWGNLKPTDPEFWEPPPGTEELHRFEMYQQMLNTFRFIKD